MHVQIVQKFWVKKLFGLDGCLKVSFLLDCTDGSSIIVKNQFGHGFAKYYLAIRSSYDMKDRKYWSYDICYWQW